MTEINRTTIRDGVEYFQANIPGNVVSIQRDENGEIEITGCEKGEPSDLGGGTVDAIKLAITERY